MLGVRRWIQAPGRRRSRGAVVSRGAEAEGGLTRIQPGISAEARAIHVPILAKGAAKVTVVGKLTLIVDCHGLFRPRPAPTGQTVVKALRTGGAAATGGTWQAKRKEHAPRRPPDDGTFRAVAAWHARPLSAVIRVLLFTVRATRALSLGCDGTFWAPKAGLAKFATRVRRTARRWTQSRTLILIFSTRTGILVAASTGIYAAPGTRVDAVERLPEGGNVSRFAVVSGCTGSSTAVVAICGRGIAPAAGGAAGRVRRGLHARGGREKGTKGAPGMVV